MAGDFPRVFVYHRFSPAGVVIPNRVSANEFAWQLGEIARRYEVLTFGQCLRHYRDTGTWPKRSAIITVDDGYRDFYEYAYPQLRKLGLKATFFVTVNFIDQKIWLWPDRFSYAIEKSQEEMLEIRLGEDLIQLFLQKEDQRVKSWKRLTDYCIAASDEERKTTIDFVEKKLKIDIADVPSSEYSAVGWDELIEMQTYGIEIGSHTMNHPILSKVSMDCLNNEIAQSKTVLEAKLNKPVVSFCYPNSGVGDINEEVVRTVREAGFWGAVFGVDLGHWDPFMVPRMGVDLNRVDFLWKLYGGELLRMKRR